MRHPRFSYLLNGRRRTGGLTWLLLVLVSGSSSSLLSGCSPHQPEVREALMRRTAYSPPPTAPSLAYHVGCPDVLEIIVAEHPAYSGRRVIEANGCIELGTSAGGARVEGMTLPEIQEQIAERLHVDATLVQARVVDYLSQKVYLFGQVTGQQRAVSYQGPETVLDLLRRVGGITRDGAPAEVRVVRQSSMEGGRPEVYRVDLQAILMEQDTRSNVIVEPYDQIHVPETSQSRFSKSLPPWLRPAGKILGTICSSVTDQP
jgi:protein involved in polysaccharide export with SLBB domain